MTLLQFAVPFASAVVGAGFQYCVTRYVVPVVKARVNAWATKLAELTK